MTTKMTENKLGPTTFPSFKNEPTDDKHLFRVVDRNGDWSHYYQDQEQRYLPAVNHILSLGFPKGIGLINWIKRMSEEEADRILRSAGERGSKVHEAIRQLIQGTSVMYGKDIFKNEDGSFSPLTIDEWDYLLSWVAWAEAFKPQALKHETAVWNKKEGYAGTVDFIGTLTIDGSTKLFIDGRNIQAVGLGEKPKTISVLLDWKTSSAIHNDYKLQTAAYAACMKQKPTQQFYTGVVRLGTKHQNGGFEMHLWSRTQTLEHYKLFLQAKNTFKFLQGNKTWQPEIEEIPLQLQVSIPIIKPKEKGKPNAGKPNQSLPLPQGQKRQPVKNQGRARVRKSVH